jgi:hypothetical protein
MRLGNTTAVESGVPSPGDVASANDNNQSRPGWLGARGCWRLRVLGLIDVVLTSDPEQIAWLNRHPDVTRPLDRDASLLHRIMHRRLALDLGFDDGVLPVFLSRADGERAARQAGLAASLEGAEGAPGWEREEIAGHIAGVATTELGPTVQQWCGRLFSEHYRSTPESYAAGRLLADWPAAPPWRALGARLSGRLARAKSVLADAAGGDPHCIHATSIGMENIARTVREMRRAAQLPELQNASASRVLARCLRAPAAVLRGCQARVEVPFLARPLTRRSLVVFLVARAYARSGDLDVAFLADGWSACPARHVVPEMLREAWYAARQGVPRENGWAQRIKPWGRVLLRAVSAFEGRAS